MERILNKIEKLEQKKVIAIKKARKYEDQVKNYENQITELNKEKMAYEMKNITYTLKKKGLNINEVLKAIENGDLEKLGEKIIEKEIEREEVKDYSENFNNNQETECC